MKTSSRNCEPDAGWASHEVKTRPCEVGVFPSHVDLAQPDRTRALGNQAYNSLKVHLF